MNSPGHEPNTHVLLHSCTRTILLHTSLCIGYFKLRLLCMPEGFKRPIEEPFSEYSTQVVFQDGYPQLVCCGPLNASRCACVKLVSSARAPPSIFKSSHCLNGKCVLDANGGALFVNIGNKYCSTAPSGLTMLTYLPVL